jgi:hypothetical protein
VRHEAGPDGSEQQESAISSALGVDRASKPIEDLGPDLSFIQNDEALPRHQGRPFEVELQPVGLLFEIEVGASKCERERGFSALPGAQQGDGGKIGEPTTEKVF